MENITKWSTFHQATLKMRSSPCSLLCVIPRGGSVAWGPAALPFTATVWPRCPYRSNFKKAHHHWALNSITETWVKKCNLSLSNKWMEVHYLNTNTGKYLEVHRANSKYYYVKGGDGQNKKCCHEQRKTFISTIGPSTSSNTQYKHKIINSIIVQ